MGPDPGGDHQQVQIAPGTAFDPAKPGFIGLGPTAGQKLFLRELPGARAQPGRTKRRTSRTYFAQLNDIQLVDEESPARIDSLAPVQPNTSAWRPQEALMPQTIDATMRRLNTLTAASPNRGALGARARWTGTAGWRQRRQPAGERDHLGAPAARGRSADGSQQRDVATTPPAPPSSAPSCSRVPPTRPPATRAYRTTTTTTTVRVTATSTTPTRPPACTRRGPQYAGLMDKAQQPFVPAGLRNGAAPVPTYVTNGNHDGAVQGFVSGTQSANALATGCFKPYINSPTTNAPVGNVFAAGTGFAVPPDPRRRFVNRPDVKRIFASGSQRDAHGFGFVDAGQNGASAGTASYYGWTPKKGLRFISLDTVSEGSGGAGGAEGNLDNPQYEWLRGELRRAKAARQMVIVFGHHPIRRLIVRTPDEAAGPCNGGVGCDSDPRSSSPDPPASRPGAAAERELERGRLPVRPLAREPHPPLRHPLHQEGQLVVHRDHRHADLPQQASCVELMDNQDGTLSLLGTQIDHAGPARAPAPTGDPAATARLRSTRWRRQPQLLLQRPARLAQPRRRQGRPQRGAGGAQPVRRQGRGPVRGRDRQGHRRRSERRGAGARSPPPCGAG